MTQISTLFRELIRPVPLLDDLDRAGRFELCARRPDLAERVRCLPLGLAAAAACLAMVGVADAATTDRATTPEPTALPAEPQTESTAATDLASAQPIGGTSAVAATGPALVSTQYQAENADTEAQITASDTSVQASGSESGAAAAGTESGQQSSTEVPQSVAVQPVTRSPLVKALVAARGRVDATTVHPVVVRLAATAWHARLKRYHTSMFQYQFHIQISHETENRSNPNGSAISASRADSPLSSSQQKRPRPHENGLRRAISSPIQNRRQIAAQNRQLVDKHPRAVERLPQTKIALQGKIAFHSDPNTRRASSPRQSVAQVAQLGDERRLLQIALAFAMVYVVFLGFWFWGTREGRRRFEGATRF